MIARLGFLVTLIALTFTSSAALGATLAGTISDEKSSPIKGMQVRLWAPSTKVKAYVVAKTATTDVSGKYKFTGVTKGNYKLDARMPAGTTGTYGDRWYDVTQPTSSGYIAENADVIAIKATDNLTGYNITMQVTGGLDTTVADKSGLKSGIQVRCEQKTEYRIHHNDFSMATFKKGSVTVTKHLGKGYFRGLLPSNYRLLLHGPDGKYETQIVAGPYKVASKKNGAATKVTMLAMAKDPYEPNDTPTDKGSAINNDIFHLTTPKPYVTSGALIGPRSGGDVDWYCFDAFATDRYIVTADTPLKVEGKVREDPWVDPVLGLFSIPKKTAKPVKVKTDDDGGPGLRDSKLDTGVLGTAGRYCMAVTTFGDTAWTGKTQMSAGRYRLTITMGNRPPKFSVGYQGTTYQGKQPLVTPSTIKVKEGAKLFFTLDFTDIDADTLTATMKMEDANSKAVTNGAFKIDSALQLSAKPSMMSPEGGGGSGGHQHGGAPAAGASTPITPGPAKAQRLSVPHAFHEELGKLWKTYQNEHAALAADDFETASTARQEFAETLGDIDMSLLDQTAHAVWMKHAASLEKAARAKGKDDIESLRQGFALLSEEMRSTLATFGVGSVYVLHCPMAFNNRGADWLQADRIVRNPYFGAAMLKCGDVTETLPATNAQ